MKRSAIPAIIILLSVISLSAQAHHPRGYRFMPPRVIIVQPNNYYGNPYCQPPQYGYPAPGAQMPMYPQYRGGYYGAPYRGGGMCHRGGMYHRGCRH